VPTMRATLYCINRKKALTRGRRCSRIPGGVATDIVRCCIPMPVVVTSCVSSLRSADVIVHHAAAAARRPMRCDAIQSAPARRQTGPRPRALARPPPPPTATFARRRRRPQRKEGAAAAAAVVLPPTAAGVPHARRRRRRRAAAAAAAAVLPCT
jgi:hypothetical protein